MSFLRIIPFAVAAVSWSLLQLIVFEPRVLYLALALGQVVFLLAVRQYIKAAAVPEHVGHAFLQPAIVYTCLTALTLFLPSRWLAEALGPLAVVSQAIPFMALELLTGAVQAYIFAVLAMVFIGGAVGESTRETKEREAE